MHTQVIGTSKRRPSRAPAADDGNPHRVLSFKQWCRLNGFSERTGRRILEEGEGTPVIQLSERRIGIRMDHNARWQESRVR
jgi:hypothetical protein